MTQRDYQFLAPDLVHTCCAPGCDVLTLNGYVACRRHWFAVPSDVRAKLVVLFRRRLTDPEAFAEAVDLARVFVARAAKNHASPTARCAS